jgi:hypothetical protein
LSPAISRSTDPPIPLITGENFDLPLQEACLIGYNINYLNCLTAAAAIGKQRNFFLCSRGLQRNFSRLQGNAVGGMPEGVV